ncbi:MAG: MFS transporter [Pseudomonadota bacterium]
MTSAGQATNPWLVVSALCLSRFSLGLQVQIIAALTPFMIADLGFSYAEIGLLIGLFLAPGVLLALPGSLLCARFGYRRVGLTGLLVMAAGSAWLIVAESFWSAAAARLLGGTGAIVMNIAFLRLTAELFEGRIYNRAIAVVMSSWTVGLGVAAVGAPLIATAGDWRLPFWIATGLALLAALSILMAVRRQPKGLHTPTAFWSLQLDRRSLVLSLLIGSAFSLYTAAGIIFLSFGPPFLVEGGMGLAEAGAAASLIIWVSLPGTPLGGWLADRSGTTATITLGILGSLALMVLMILGPAPLVLAALLGLLWGMPAAPFTGLLQTLLPAQAVSAGYGLYFTLFYAGFFVFPALAGWFADLVGSTVAALWFGVLLMAIAAALHLGSDRLKVQPSA